MTLAIDDHNRNILPYSYVYPVLSRRAEGVSIGINLNINNACNWRCIYCQVPELTRGKAPNLDLQVLARELREFILEVKAGDFLQTRVPIDSRRINDIALSGNGEPTSSPQFGEVIEIIAELKKELLSDQVIKTVLITNGSLLHVGNNVNHLRRLNQQNGEIWFKLDRVLEKERSRVNDVQLRIDRIARNLSLAADNCATWVQTCLFSLDGQDPSNDERREYIKFIEKMKYESVPIKGVMIYGPNRKSYQPEASRISPVSEGWIESFCSDLRALGIVVRYTP